MRTTIALCAAVLCCAMVSGAAPERAQAVTDCGLTAPANLTVANAPNQAGAAVSYSAPTTTGTCSTVTCSPASGSFYALGTTMVTCTASTSPPVKASFTITVNDTQSPTLSATSNVSANTDPGKATASVSFPLPTATDNAPGVSVSCNRVSGDPFRLGTTTVTCTAIDRAGNTDSRSFLVIVSDAEAPVIELAPDVNVTAPPGVTSVNVPYNLPDGHDNSAAHPAIACTPPPGSAFALGTTRVSCTATDAAGNAATKTFQVIVAHDPVKCAQAQAALAAAQKELKQAKKSKRKGRIKRAKAKVAAAQAAVLASC